MRLPGVGPEVAAVDAVGREGDGEAETEVGPLDAHRPVGREGPAVGVDRGGPGAVATHAGALRGGELDLGVDVEVTVDGVGGQEAGEARERAAVATGEAAGALQVAGRAVGELVDVRRANGRASRSVVDDAEALDAAGHHHRHRGAAATRVAGPGRVADRATRAAAVVVGLEVDADAPAEREARAAARGGGVAAAARAGLAARAGRAAGAAVAHVRVERRAAVAADALARPAAGRRGGRAATRVAGLARRAPVAAGAAVVGIGLEATAARDARVGPAGTRRCAGAAVGRAGHAVLAGHRGAGAVAAAHGRLGLGAQDALTSLAHAVGRAVGAAATAVVGVGREVGAETAAGRETHRAGRLHRTRVGRRHGDVDRGSGVVGRGGARVRRDHRARVGRGVGVVSGVERGAAADRDGADETEADEDAIEVHLCSPVSKGHEWSARRPPVICCETCHHHGACFSGCDPATSEPVVQASS